MRYRSRLSRRSAGIDFNATPMIDVIFMLTVFFSLVGRFSSEEHLPMKLPSPEESQAQEALEEERVVLNCRPVNAEGPALGVEFSVGPNAPEPLGSLVGHLQVLKSEAAQSGRQLRVLVRADRRLRFSDVRPAMQVLAALDIPMLNVAAQSREEGS